MQNRPKIIPKSSKNRWKIHPKSSKVARVGPPGGLLEASWEPLGVLGAFWKFRRASWGRLGGQHGSNLAPKTEPKSIKNRSQNQSILECLLRVDFYRNLMDFGRKMEPSWHLDGIRNRCQLRRMIFWENFVFPWEKNDFEGSGGWSWNQKSNNNPLKKELKLGRPLGIDFSLI